MTLKSAPFYWVECDGCGVRCDYGEFAAWEQDGAAEEGARDWDWQIKYGKSHYCPDCPRCTTCGGPAGDLSGLRDYECGKCWLTKDRFKANPGGFHD
jgi:hypothetical protein